MSEKNFTITKVEKLPHSEATVVGEVPLEFLEQCREEALKHLNQNISLPGFRPGLVPNDVLVKTVGEMKVLEETAEIALGKEYGNIVLESKLRPITRPQIAVTKLAPGIPLEFKMHLLLEPEFELPDYKKLASEVAATSAQGSGGPKKEDEAKSTEGGSPDSQSEFREKKRLKILENLIKETKLEIPNKLIEAELHHTLSHFKQDIDKAGVKWEDYLEKIGKTEEEVKESWREQVVSHAKAELILGKIAEKENLKTYAEVFALLEKKD